jgi:hypothetical protein
MLREIEKGLTQLTLRQPPNLPGQLDCPKGGRERPDYTKSHYRDVGLWCQESSYYGGQPWRPKIRQHHPAFAGCIASASSTGARENPCTARMAGILDS